MDLTCHQRQQGVMADGNEKLTMDDRRFQIRSSGWRCVHFNRDRQLLCRMRTQPALRQQTPEAYEGRMDGCVFMRMNRDLKPCLIY